jgi:hypothetical protein
MFIMIRRGKMRDIQIIKKHLIDLFFVIALTVSNFIWYGKPPFTG